MLPDVLHRVTYFMIVGCEPAWLQCAQRRIFAVIMLPPLVLATNM